MIKRGSNWVSCSFMNSKLLVQNPWHVRLFEIDLTERRDFSYGAFSVSQHVLVFQVKNVQAPLVIKPVGDMRAQGPAWSLSFIQESKH